MQTCSTTSTCSDEEGGWWRPTPFILSYSSLHCFWPRCRPLSGSFEWRRVAKADLGPLGELCIQAADGWPDAWPARTATRWAVVDLVFCEKWKVPKPNTQVHHYLKLLWQWHLAQVQVSARLHQPVQLRFCQFNLMLVCWHLPLLKYPSEASAAWHASPKNYLVQFQKQWGRLTCTPDQVKKLLYCTKQKGSQASTGSSSTQDVSDRKFIHFLKHHMFLWFCFLCGIQVSWSMHLVLFILKYQSSCLLEELLVEVGSGKFLG